ncbi:MAG: nuclear transport factor 2 family protein [Solimonas sp.]
MYRYRSCLFALVLAATSFSTSALAEWKAAGADVKTAMEDPRVAAALATVSQLDRAVIDDDHAAFAALMADDLVVNNPQNTLSIRGATTQLNASGRISYSKYERTIEYAGLRGGMVLIMGEELCVPKPPNPMAGQPVRRRFTDLWKNENGRWLLTARQATIIPAAIPAAR